MANLLGDPLDVGLQGESNLMSTKIAIVCGHFLPELGYLEVDLAKGLSRSGNEVHVFTSAEVPNYLKDRYQIQLCTGVKEMDGYIVHRLNCLMSIGQIVIPMDLAQRVELYSPQVVIVIGLGKRFPMDLVKEKWPWSTICLLGDNSASFSAKRTWLHKKVKDPVYRAAVKNSDALFHYTPDAADIVSAKLNENEKELFFQKSRPISLPFDELTFYFDEDLRADCRSKYDIQDTERIGISSGRCSAEKRIDNLLEEVDEWIQSGLLSAFHLIGLSNDADSDKVRQVHSRLSSRDLIRLHPVMSHAEINAHFNMADVGFWTRPAISIQQALGTGLRTFFTAHDALSHLHNLPQSGLIEQFATDINEGASLHDRRALSKIASEQFGLTAICRTIEEYLQPVDQ